jgi:hypothetical protein
MRMTVRQKLLVFGFFAIINKPLKRGMCKDMTIDYKYIYLFCVGSVRIF